MNVDIAIVVRGGLVLVCQRRAEMLFGGCWEFPGGKREPGETSQHCVVREVFEEVGIHVRPTVALEPIEHDYPHGRVRLHPHLCEHVAGEPQLLACQAIRWVSPPELRSFEFPPANGPLIDQVIRRLHPATPPTCL